MSDLPRLLFCCFDVVPAPSAISRRLTEYLKGLSERFQVVVLSVKTPDHPHIERYHGARLLRVPVGSGDFLARVQAFDRAVRRQLESEEYLAVHFFDPFGGYALAERRGELGYKLVYDACAFPSLEMTTTQPDVAANRRFVAKARRQELFCLMNADAVIVGNPLTRDWVSTMGVEAEHIHLLPAPVDLALYTPESMGRPDSSVMKVLHVGSLAAHHGLPLLLEAAALVIAGGPEVPPVDLQVTVVGPQNPEWKARLEEQVQRLGLTAKVDFQAPVTHDDLHKVLAAADVGLLALEDNERNRVVGSVLSRLGEYLAAGRPVVAADVPAARQLCPADAVSWFAPGDANSLAAALRSLALDPAKRVAMGETGRAAAEKWDGMKIRADLIAVYTTITGQTVQRVPDEEQAADPNEPTQMGQSVLAAEAGEVTQLGVRAFVPKDDSAPGTNKVKVALLAKDDSSPGTNKVRTDPAITGPDSSTDSQRLGDRPAVMGVPLREEAPIVAGEELPVVPPPPWKVPGLEEVAPQIVAGALIEDAPEYIKPLTMPALLTPIPIASSPTQIVPALSGVPTPVFVTPIAIPLEQDVAVSSLVTPLSLGGVDSSGYISSLTPPPMASSPTVIEPLEMPTFGPSHSLSAPVEDSLRGLPRFSAPAAEAPAQAPSEASHLVDAQIIAPRRPESGGRSAVSRAARNSAVDSSPTPAPFSEAHTSGVRAAAADDAQGVARVGAEFDSSPGRGASGSDAGAEFDAQGRRPSGSGPRAAAGAVGTLDSSSSSGLRPAGEVDAQGRGAAASGARAAAGADGDSSRSSGVRPSAEFDPSGRTSAAAAARGAGAALDASGVGPEVDAPGRGSSSSGHRATAGTDGDSSRASAASSAGFPGGTSPEVDAPGRGSSSSGHRATAGTDGDSSRASAASSAGFPGGASPEIDSSVRAATASGVRASGDSSRSGVRTAGEVDTQGRGASSSGVRTAAAAEGDSSRSSTVRTAGEIDAQGRGASSSGARTAEGDSSRSSGGLPAEGDSSRSSTVRTAGEIDPQGRASAASGAGGLPAASSGVRTAAAAEGDSSRSSGVRTAGEIDPQGRASGEGGVPASSSFSSGVRTAAAEGVSSRSSGMRTVGEIDAQGRGSSSSGVRTAAADGDSSRSSGVRTAGEIDPQGRASGAGGLPASSSGVRAAAAAEGDSSRSSGASGAGVRPASSSGVRAAAVAEGASSRSSGVRPAGDFDASGRGVRPTGEFDPQARASAAAATGLRSGTAQEFGVRGPSGAEFDASGAGGRAAPGTEFDAPGRSTGSGGRAVPGGVGAELDASRSSGLRATGSEFDPEPPIVAGVRTAAALPVAPSSPSTVRSASGPVGPTTFPTPAPSATRPTSTSGVLPTPTAPRSPSGVLPPVASRPSGLQPPPLTASSSPSRPPGVPPPLPPSAFSSSGSRPPALPVPSAPSVPSAPRVVPPLVLPDSFGERSSTSSSSSSLSIAPMSLPPISAPTYSTAGFPSRPPPPLRAAPADEVLEIADDEVESMESELEAAVVQQIEAAAREEEEVISSDETIQAVDTDSSVPFSGIDPWLAQVVHGYCPPGSNIFDRHVPPTTMPGRDK